MCVYKYIERIDGKEINRIEFTDEIKAYEKIHTALAGILAREERNLDGVLNDIERFWNSNHSMSTDVLGSKLFALRRSATGNIISAKRELEDGTVWSANVTKTNKN